MSNSTGEMTKKMPVDLGNVQKTLLLPLWGRAFETRKDRPLLVDRKAVEIIDKVDYDFTALSQNLSELTQLAWIMRSLCTDQVIRAFLAKYPRGTIVNIGCGLDTTLERVDNGILQWYDLDLPDVIRLRRQLIAGTDRSKLIASSFLEQDWLEAIRVEESVLFIAAGVFHYFQEQDIRGFLSRLADRFPGSELLFDVSSPRGVRMANRVVIRSSGLDDQSYLKWGLENPKVIASWDRRLRIVKLYFYFGERARPLKLRTRLIGLVSDWLKIQYMIHLEIAK